jgi:DNA-binding transcriptional MocR family regulator
MPDEDKARLVALLAQRNIPLIEDDVYGDLAFDGGRPRPAKAFDRDGNVLLCGSVSKTLAAGYRVGWIAPGRFETAVLRAKRANTMEGALLPQLAVAEFFSTGAYDRHLRVLRRKLGVQLARLRAAVSLHFPRGTRMSAPEGGLVLWVELPRGFDTRALYAEAARRRISIAPGVLFASKPRFTRFLRLNGGTPWSDTLEAAVRALGRACLRAT